VDATFVSEGSSVAELAPPPAFHLLAKPTGALCNLDCAYCFFLSKEMLYPGSRFRMADDLLELYIRQLIETHRTPEVTIAWQGGEPTLMGLDFFRRSVELAERHAGGKQIEYTIQTNGTLLDDEWGQFFKRHGFLVGISIDGPRELHDAFRVDKGGKGSFDKVMRGLDVLRRHDVDYNTLTTLHSANAERATEVYRFLRDECDSRYHQYIPIIERVAETESVAGANGSWSSWRDRPLYTQKGECVSERSVTAEQYGRFLIEVFEEWVRRDVGEVYVQMFDVALANWVGEPPSLCIHSQACGSALALEHNGDLYSCDHFVEPAYKLGNIRMTHMLDLVSAPEQRRFGQNKLDALPRFCRECDVRFACHGGCPKDRFIATPDGEAGLNYLCTGYKAFFHHVDRPMRVMGALLADDRAPREIVALYAAGDAKRSRNDACPCGSGRKWKQCHGSR
jgi:uncharacterized protein